VMAVAENIKKNIELVEKYVAEKKMENPLWIYVGLVLRRINDISDMDERFKTIYSIISNLLFLSGFNLNDVIAICEYIKYDILLKIRGSK